ncbi:hypothetical protein Scep_009656 [Stephania cephalantha]|uniref:Uncharacterized protein n=1 Tax=Stephania cephalantha TaxID=152367 RepID=A0AAP0PGE0_9MAGN
MDYEKKGKDLAIDTTSEEEFEDSSKKANASDEFLSSQRDSEEEIEEELPNEPTEDETPTIRVNLNPLYHNYEKYQDLGGAKKDAVMDDEMLHRLKDTMKQEFTNEMWEMKHFLIGKMTAMERRLTDNVTKNSSLVEVRLRALEHEIASYGNELTKEMRQLNMRFDQAKYVASRSDKQDAGHGSSSMEF